MGWGESGDNGFAELWKKIKKTFVTKDENLEVKKYLPLNATTDTGWLITDALGVNTSSNYGVENKPGYVYAGGSINMPSSCVTGIREVYFYNSTNIVIKITGIDNRNTPTEWFNFYNGSDWVGWNKIEPYQKKMLISTPIYANITNSIVPLDDDINNYKNLSFAMQFGDSIVFDELTIDKDLFKSNVFNPRLSYYDGANIYQCQVNYQDDTHILVSTVTGIGNWSSVTMKLVVIGFK